MMILVLKWTRIDAFTPQMDRSHTNSNCGIKLTSPPLPFCRMCPPPPIYFFVSSSLVFVHESKAVFTPKPRILHSYTCIITNQFDARDLYTIKERLRADIRIERTKLTSKHDCSFSAMRNSKEP